MSRSNLRIRTMDKFEKLEAIHRTNPVAQKAFKQGNAAGFHGKDENKIARRTTRREEELARRGIYDDPIRDTVLEDLEDYENEISEFDETHF